MKIEIVIDGKKHVKECSEKEVEKTITALKKLGFICLALCPFCGGEAEPQFGPLDNTIECEDCGASIYRSPKCFEGTNSRGGANDCIEAWNRRAP